MINSYEKGGLKMVDFESYFQSLKASWVKRLTETSVGNWKIIPLKYYNIFGHNLLIFKMNIENIKHLPDLEQIPEFYREIIRCWVKSGGGQMMYPKDFLGIRKQVIWGNKFIKTGQKYLIFKNWIKSGFIFINDIIDEKGKLSEGHILNKLNSKVNWISEFSVLKKAIPKEWFVCLSHEKSIKTTVNIKKRQLVWRGIFIDANTLNNKTFYNILVEIKATKSIGNEVWIKYLNLNEHHNMSDTYFFIFNYLEENKFKVFRWKLLQSIIPTKQLLNK